MNEPTNDRQAILAAYLEVDRDDLEPTAYDECAFSLGSKEYLILTDDEADERAAQDIAESLWAFNASFLASYTDLPEEIFKALQPQCEAANNAILKLIERSDNGLESLIEEAILADGRGHFMSTYDGNEDEYGDFYIYRIN